MKCECGYRYKVGDKHCCCCGKDIGVVEHVVLCENEMLEVHLHCPGCGKGWDMETRRPGSQNGVS